MSVLGGRFVFGETVSMRSSERWKGMLHGMELGVWFCLLFSFRFSPLEKPQSFLSPPITVQYMSALHIVVEPVIKDGTGYR